MVRRGCGLLGRGLGMGNGKSAGSGCHRCYVLSLDPTLSDGRESDPEVGTQGVGRRLAGRQRDKIGGE